MIIRITYPNLLRGSDFLCFLFMNYQLNFQFIFRFVFPVGGQAPLCVLWLYDICHWGCSTDTWRSFLGSWECGKLQMSELWQENKIPSIQSPGKTLRYDSNNWVVQRKINRDHDGWVILHTVMTVGSLSNHDDDGANKNVTNLHIFYLKTVVLHALHVRF